MWLTRKKILVTGGSGFLGSYVVRELVRRGADKRHIIIPRSKKIDLRKERNCLTATKGIDIIIHLAGNVGGIGKNSLNPATLFYDNALMGIHLIHAAMKSNVQKLVIIGTICAYPKYTTAPFREEDLWQGYPEETNAPYGIAKKMLLVAAQAYKQQHKLNSIYLLPVNLYGPGDNFDPTSSHVIPATIRKVYQALKNHESSIVVWGDGTPTREFLYVEDAARAIAQATIRYNTLEPINLGSGHEISIKELVFFITKLMRYKGKIVWDTTKPNGQPRRLLDISKATNEFGFRARVPLHIGLKRTINWFYKHYAT